MKTKNIISMENMTKEEIEKLLKQAHELTEKTYSPAGKTAALLFNRPSTRTHVSFAVALQHMGYGSIYLDYVFTQLVRGEQLKDGAKALSQYVELIIARLVPDSMLEELAAYSEVPVINAGSTNEHPCQALGDLYTISQMGKLKRGNTIVFIGDPVDPVAHSLSLGAMKLGLEFTYLCPKGYEPRNKKAAVSHDLESVREADVVYTNAWAHDMETDPKRMRDLLPYQLNDQLLSKAPAEVTVMHPLPAFRGLEISDTVLDSVRSVVWKQVKNRLYIQKAIIQSLE